MGCRFFVILFVRNILKYMLIIKVYPKCYVSLKMLDKKIILMIIIYICVPFRSHIHHKNAFLFKNTERLKTDSSGLDYSKTVLIRLRIMINIYLEMQSLIQMNIRL